MISKVKTIQVDFMLEIHSSSSLQIFRTRFLCTLNPLSQIVQNANLWIKLEHDSWYLISKGVKCTSLILYLKMNIIGLEQQSIAEI